MEISKLIKELEFYKDKFGDVEVFMTATLNQEDNKDRSSNTFKSTVEAVKPVKWKDKDALQVFWQM